MQSSFQDPQTPIDTFFVFEIPMPSEYDVLRAIDLCKDMKIWWESKNAPFNFTASVSERSKNILVLSNEEGETNLEGLVGTVLKIGEERKIHGRAVLRYAEFSVEGVAGCDNGGYIIFDFDRREAKQVDLNRVLEMDAKNKPFKSRHLHQIIRDKNRPLDKTFDGILNVIFRCLPMKSS